MDTLKTIMHNDFNGNIMRIRLALFLSFCTLIIFQLVTGYKNFDDYLIAFIFILFLNDLYYKIKYPSVAHFQHDQIKRRTMSLIFVVLFSLPFLFDTFNISDQSRIAIYKLGFILWGQVFLIDTFLHFKQTHSKQWLVFTSFAVLMIVCGAFIY